MWPARSLLVFPKNVEASETFGYQYTIYVPYFELYIVLIFIVELISRWDNSYQKAFSRGNSKSVVDFCLPHWEKWHNYWNSVESGWDYVLIRRGRASCVIKSVTWDGGRNICAYSFVINISEKMTRSYHEFWGEDRCWVSEFKTVICASLGASHCLFLITRSNK